MKKIANLTKILIEFLQFFLKKFLTQNYHKFSFYGKSRKYFSMEFFLTNLSKNKIIN